MAQFKIGQRVKKVRMRRPEHVFDPDTVYGPVPIGTEGVIAAWNGALPNGDYAVRYNFPTACRHDLRAVYAYEIEPIVDDPKADEFVERIKKLKPYEEPKRGDRLRLRDGTVVPVGPNGEFC